MKRQHHPISSTIIMRMRIFSKKEEVEHISLGRTLESTIFEVVALFLVIALWALAVWMYRHAPESIPTYIDASGQPNNDGSRLVLLYMAGLGTFVTLLMMLAAYHATRFVNLPVKIDNIRRVTLASRMVRIMALLLCLLHIIIIFQIAYPEAPQPVYLLGTWVVLIILIPIIFCILIKRDTNHSPNQ